MFPDEYSDDISKIPDIIGFRISLDDEDSIYDVASIIDRYFGLLYKINYLDSPKENGYKALAYYMKSNKISVEIQVMTKQMRDWVNATHTEYEAIKYGRSENKGKFRLCLYR